MDLEGQFERAIRERRAVRLDYAGTGQREVEPYALCRTAQGSLVIVGFQRTGYSRSGRSSGWKTLDLNSVTRIQVLDEVFSPRADYNPEESKRFVSVIVEVSLQ